MLSNGDTLPPSLITSQQACIAETPMLKTTIAKRSKHPSSFVPDAQPYPVQIDFPNHHNHVDLGISDDEAIKS